MELREGNFYRRKLTGYLWRIEALNPNGDIAIKQELGYERPEREMLTEQQFRESFEPA